MRSWRALVAFVVGLSLVGAACSSTDDAAPDADASVTSSSPDSAADGPASSDPGAVTETTGDRSTVTGSTTGISEDAVKVGVMELNLGAVGSAVGGELALANTVVGEAYRVFADLINAEGGIDGRELEVTIYPFNPIDESTMQSGCIRATEEDGNFVVVAMGAYHVSSLLCLAAQHDTVTIGCCLVSDTDLATAGGKLFITGTTESRQYRGLVQALDEAGVLEGKTIGIVRESTQDIRNAVEDSMIPELERRGYEVAAVAELPCTVDDRVCGQHENAVEVLRDAGVDGLFDAAATLSNPAFIQAAVDVGYFPEYYSIPFNTAPTLTEFVAKGSPDRAAAYDGAYSISTIAHAGDIHPEFPLPRPPQPGEASYECNNAFEDATGEGYAFDPQGGAQNNDSRALITGACDVMYTLAYAMRAASPNLNSETLALALTDLTDIDAVLPWTPVTDVAGKAERSFGPDKFDAANRYTIVRFDADDLQWHPTTQEYIWPE